MDIPIRSHRRNMSARGHIKGDDRLSINDVSKSRRSPLKRVFGRKQQRSNSAPARIGRKHLLVEDHYRVDPVDKRLLPGLPVSDEDWARDLHDFFNLVALVPVVVLNMMNWNWDILLDPNSEKKIQEAWVGDWFSLFFAVVVGYFVADLIWVILVPKCVKSPGVIIQHHIATLLYLLFPYIYPKDAWLMGACLMVEINTWLLIARRVFNKQGFTPWVIGLPQLFSIRIKLISVLFYITWITIRCFLYPVIMKILLQLWWNSYRQTSSLYSHYTICILLHSVFCVLNFKWTFDLFASKLRAWKLGKDAKIEKGL
ncbi:hypothetical protein ACHAWO_012413 [Cyclotella atomus]|uniref:TLC domain-containing protein n=1 Tax=Cyclotella atomus TaxID=382360 RepID=A0ABD3Q2B4_9STRA